MAAAISSPRHNNLKKDGFGSKRDLGLPSRHPDEFNYHWPIAASNSRSPVAGHGIKRAATAVPDLREGVASWCQPEIRARCLMLHNFRVIMKYNPARPMHASGPADRRAAARRSCRLAAHQSWCSLAERRECRNCSIAGVSIPASRTAGWGPKTRAAARLPARSGLPGGFASATILAAATLTDPQPSG